MGGGEVADGLRGRGVGMHLLLLRGGLRAIHELLLLHVPGTTV